MLDKLGSLLGGAAPMDLLGGPSKAGETGGIGGLLGGLLGGSEGGIFSDILEVVTAGGPGSILNKALDSLGLPDVIGDLAGTVLDACTGNIPGALSNGLDALEDVANDLGLEELAPYLKMGSEITNMFSNPTSALQNIGVGGDAMQLLDVANQVKGGEGGGGLEAVIGTLAGGGGGGDLVSTLGPLLAGGGAGGVDSADVNGFGALLGLFGGGEMAGEVAGSVRV